MTDSVEVPFYFICPVSLQLMRDPVTTTTGITYDRDSIERWLFVDHRLTCPVTNEPLPSDAELTPNHTVRRLIQSWSALHAAERIPTPRPPADLPTVQNLLSNLTPSSLTLLASLAAESESNRRLILRAGAPHRLLSSLSIASSSAADQALSLLLSLRISPDVLYPLVANNYNLVDSLYPFLLASRSPSTRSNAILFLKSAFVLTGPKLARLRFEFFRAVVGVIRDGISTQATKAALHVLLNACPLGTSRARMVAAGAVAEIVELELSAPEKRTTELGLSVLQHLCMCADGRAELLRHAAGIAVVAKRMIGVSPAADEKAVGILKAVSGRSATAEVLMEMLSVGAVSKLCLVMQAECLRGVREKAAAVLRLHSSVWKNSPCINDYPLSVYP